MVNIDFSTWAIVTHGLIVPGYIRTRSELVNFMIVSSTNTLEAIGQANSLYTEYTNWLISIDPVDEPRRSFKVFLSGLTVDQLDSAERTVRDEILADREFPRAAWNNLGIDRIIDYLQSQNAPDVTIDATEKLWIRYLTKE